LSDERRNKFRAILQVAPSNHPSKKDRELKACYEIYIQGLQKPAGRILSEIQSIDSE